MAEIKGVFLSQLIGLMSLYEDALKLANQKFKAKSGIHWNEVNAEKFYDVSSANFFIDAYIKASPTGEIALITLGKQFIPVMKREKAIPPTIKTPLQFVEFEAKMYEQVHRGEGVYPRKIIKSAHNLIELEATSPGYNSKIFIGVYEGVLSVAGVKNGKVVQTKCQEKGSPTSEYTLTWN